MTHHSSLTWPTPLPTQRGDDGVFRLDIDEREETLVRLIAHPRGSEMPHKTIWARRFDTEDDRDAVLAQIGEDALDLAFHARLAMIFGPESVDATVEGILVQFHAAREVERAQKAEKARQHRIVNLYTRRTKRGHVLELQRDSHSKGEWMGVYDRAIDRDRLCDWLRWQKSRFLEFLDYAAEHGGEALTRALTDEMFAAEARIKQEGRGAGGMRPLRMWRGE